MKSLSTPCLAALSSLLLGATAAHGAWTVTWNTAASAGGYVAPLTYDGTSNLGGIRNTTGVIEPSAFSLAGFGDGAGGSRLTLTGVPLAYDLGYYVELPMTIDDGFAFEPDQIRVATAYGINPAIGTSDRSASFQVRSSLDNYASLLGTSAVDPTSGRNPISGGGGALVNYDQVADISSVGALVGSVTFRLYFQDTNGSVNIAGSTETLPEGMRIVGPAAYAVPEPSAALLVAAGAILAGVRRRRA